jgi:ABC-type lipoprotein release transport system permease subunit
MSGLLYAVKPTDLLTFVGVSMLLAGFALAACWLPARRAARAEPMAALRHE